MHIIKILLVASCCVLCAGTHAFSEATAPAESDPAVAPAVKPARPSWGHRILWYLPNRMLDLFDMVRLRARAGPGIAINLRMTDHVNLYAGQYKSVYVGLPGPRRAPTWPTVVGFERERGLIVMGVDATDDWPDEPDYKPTEIVLGAHVLLVGCDIGVDPLEMADFLGGFIFRDPVKDDH
jgi:hypothetical protein